MNILMVSAEMAPFAKVGGLADVTTALSRALAVRGHDVRVVLPLYGHLDREKLGIAVLRKLPPLSLRVGRRMLDIRFHRMGTGREAVKVLLVECEELYGAGGVYPTGEAARDGLARAALHAQAALLLPRLLEWPVDIVHAHDAEAAPALLYRREWYAGRELPGPAATVLTIHNLAHQEIHAADGVQELGLPPGLAAYPGLLEFHGRMNLLKGGILGADRVNTVSPTYARETVADPEFGCGLEGALAARGTDYAGILNGADYDDWDPGRDPHLPAAFTADDMAGRAACREALHREVGLEPTDQPVFGFVGRLVHQKGMSLALPLLERLAGDGFGFVILGTGDPDLEKATAAAAARLPGRVAYVSRFDEGLGRRIYAGCDAFLMPSLFEPCGLSQMYALRYGAPPLVRRTGGLADTVTDAAAADGDGFVFDEPRPEALLAAVRRCEALWRDAGAWRGLQERGMGRRFDWSRAAEAYEELYARALARD